MPPALTLADLDHPDSLWNRAAAAGSDDQADPLCCRSEWQLTFDEVLGRGQRTVVRTTADSLVAFAVHREPTLGHVLTPFDWSWRFGSPWLGPDGIELMRATVDELAGHGLPASVLVTGIVPGSASERRILRAFPGWSCWPQDEQEVCVASLDGGFDAFLSRRSGQMRRNLRKASSRAAALGVRFERCAPRDGAGAQAAFARIAAVEALSWKGQQAAGVAHPEAGGFYRRLLERTARSGLARVVFARRGDEDLGFLFGGLARGMFRAQQCSFADRWRPHSIGNLLQLETVRWLCEDGAAWYHMGPTMGYKPHWAEVSRTMASRLFVPRG